MDTEVSDFLIDRPAVVGYRGHFGGPEPSGSGRAFGLFLAGYSARAPRTTILRRHHMPAPRKRDQSAPTRVSPTGASKSTDEQPDPRAQSGRFLTTAQGVRIPDTDHSLKAGSRVTVIERIPGAPR